MDELDLKKLGEEIRLEHERKIQDYETRLSKLNKLGNFSDYCFANFDLESALQAMFLPEDISEDFYRLPIAAVAVWLCLGDKHLKLDDVIKSAVANCYMHIISDLEIYHRREDKSDIFDQYSLARDYDQRLLNRYVYNSIGGMSSLINRMPENVIIGTLKKVASSLAVAKTLAIFHAIVEEREKDPQLPLPSLKKCIPITPIVGFLNNYEVVFGTRDNSPRSTRCGVFTPVPEDQTEIERAFKQRGSAVALVYASACSASGPGTSVLNALKFIAAGRASGGIDKYNPWFERAAFVHKNIIPATSLEKNYSGLSEFYSKFEPRPFQSPLSKKDRARAIEEYLKQ